jgi:hypothetical protein
MNLVIRDRLRYGGDDYHVLVEFGESLIEFLIAFAIDVVIAWKS